MRNFKLGTAVLLSGVMVFGVAHSVVANNPNASDLGDNVVAPPIVTSPDDGDRVKTPMVKLSGTTQAKFKVTVMVNGNQKKFHGKKYLTADKDGDFQALVGLGEGMKSDVREIAVYAVNPDTGKMSQATTVTVVYDTDMILTQFHGQVGYCDDDGKFMMAPQSKKVYFYHLGTSQTDVAVLPLGSEKINKDGEYTVNLFGGYYAGLVGGRAITAEMLPIEGMFTLDMTQQEGKDLGVTCLDM